MKFFRSLWLLAALGTHAAAAQDDLAGTWQGALQLAPDSALTIHFVITAQPDGGYDVVLTSPDTGAIRDVPASGVTFDDGALNVEVDALSGAYAGVLRDGVIEGEWSQEGTALPLTLRPYTAPVLTQADIDTLRGEWVGTLRVAGLELAMVFRFATDDEGNLESMFDSPDQNARNIPVTDVVLEDGSFSVRVPAVLGEYSGTLADDTITGAWRQAGGTPIPLTVTKGEYVAPSRHLDLPAAAREQLAGSWRGTLGPLTLVLRFEADEQGDMLGFLDSPDQGALGIPITAAALADGTLTLSVGSIGAEYTGALRGDTLEGEWTQLGGSNPLTLARE